MLAGFVAGAAALLAAPKAQALTPVDLFDDRKARQSGFDLIYEARDLDLPQSIRDGLTQVCVSLGLGWVGVVTEGSVMASHIGAWVTLTSRATGSQNQKGLLSTSVTSRPTSCSTSCTHGASFIQAVGRLDGVDAVVTTCWCHGDSMFGAGGWVGVLTEGTACVMARGEARAGLKRQDSQLAPVCI